MTKKKLTLTDTIKLGKQGVDIMKNDGATAEEAVRRLGITPRDAHTTIPTQQKDILAPYRENMRSLITGDAKNENNHSEPIFTVPKTSNWGLSAVRGAAQPGFKGNDPKSDAQALYKYMDVETFDKLNQEVFPTIQKIYNDEYVTPLELDRLKRIVNNNSEKLKAYQNYYNLYGGTDLTELGNLYSSVQKDLPNINEYYDNFDSEKSFENWKKGMSIDIESYKDEMQIHSKNYTEALKANDKEKYAKSRGYKDFNDLKKQATESNELLEHAKSTQGYNDYEQVGNPSSKHYDPDFEKYAKYIDPTEKKKKPGIYINPSNEAEYRYINGTDEERMAIKLWEDHMGMEYTGYEQMTEQQKKTYNYYYNNPIFGPEKAAEYFKTIRGDLAVLHAPYLSEKYKGDYLFNLQAGMESSIEGARKAIDGIFGTNLSYKENPRATEIVSAEIREGIKKENGILGTIGYDLMGAIGEELVEAPVSAVNPWLGVVYTGASAGGNAYYEALNEGYTQPEARNYAIMKGVLTGTIDKVFGTVGNKTGIGKKWANKVGALSEDLDNAFLRVAIRTGGNAAPEALEGATESFIDPFLRNLATGGEANAEVDWEQVIYDGIMEGLAGATLSLPGSVVSDASRNSYLEGVGKTALSEPYITKQIISTGVKNNVPEAIEIVNTMATGKPLTAKEMGRTIEKVISDSVTKNGGMMNIMNIVSALEGRDSSYTGSVEAVDTAKAIMNFVQGKATDVDKAIISRSDGATTLLTTIESDQKAWSSIKDAAIKELKPTTKEINMETKYSAENVTVSDGNVYTRDGKMISITKDADIVNGIVVSGEQKRFKEKNAKGYKVIEKWATELKKPVKLVKGLYDEDGNMLDGVETAEGIFINTEATNPVKWAASHEFSHTIKKSAGETWAKYQSYVIDQLKKKGTYYRLFEAKAKAYGTDNVTYLNEEIAADYIGDAFDSVEELANFIKKGRGLATKVRDIYYKVLDKLNLLDEKKKAQLMWADAYRKAVLNTEKGKVESSAEKKSVNGTRVSEADSKDVSNPYGINSSDIKAIQSIPRKSINEFSSKEIETTEKFARKYWEEMKKKSPFFRAWYGDWREYDNGTHAIVQKSNSNKPENGRTTNKDTGKILSWNTGTVVRETINHAVKDKVSIVAVNDLKKIIEEAIYFDTFVSSPSSKTKMQNTAFMHSFYSLYKSENGMHLLKLYAEEALSNNEKNVFSRAYQLKDIEKVADIPNGVSEGGASLSDDISATTISISELFNLVKQYDKNFNPNPVNPDLLNSDGTPKNLYHQTSEEIDIFEPRHKGAGTTDEETPFGIFLKPTPEDIGLKGKHQMAVYAKIVNPLDVVDRNELVSSLKTLSSEFSTLYDNYKNLNKEYKKKAEEAEKNFNNYVKKWREANPSASRIDIYKEAEFDEIFKAEDKIVEEWESNARKAELEIKKVITKTLKNNNYDGVHLLKDAGSGGRIVETWIALEPEQVKSATGNIGTFDKGNPNNKKSISGTRESEIDAGVTSKIENLAASAGIDLEKAVKKGITTQEFKKAALDLRKENGSKIKLAELTKDLTDLYTFAQSDKATPDMVNQIASNIADKVVGNVTQTVTNNEYSDLLNRIKDTKIMVPEAERADFKDGYETFRKGNMGKLTLANDGLDLDVFWDELTEQYPNLFDENILGSEERLERILEVREEFSPKEQIVFETNNEMQVAKDKITNKILEKIVKVPATKKAENLGKFVESVEQKLDLSNKKTTRKAIDSDYNYLSQIVRNPTDAKHIPEDLRPAVARLLNCFNYETKSIEKLRAEGKEMDSPTAVRIDSMYNAYTDIIKKSWGIEATEDSQFADKFLSDDIKEMIGEIPANEDGGFKKLEDMSIDELRAMAKVLHSVHHMITQRNKTFNSAIDENISELGFNAAEDFKTIRNRRKGSGEKLDYNTTAIQKASRIVDKYFNYDNVQPWDFFHEMGGTMERLYMEERRAFNKHILNIKSASETISKATTGMDLDKLTGKGAEKIWFETDMGEKIRLSKGQILSLYALYGRKQGKEHILGGGIVLGTEAKDSAGDKISAHTAHAVTEADMGRLFEKHITEDEKAMVSQIVDFMSKECAKWGNETSMKLYGYEKFGENWYFPIKVSKVTLNQFSGKKGEGNQRTQSFTKSTTKNASNAVEIGDFFDTVTSHINGVSLYNTTALPMLDMERVLNYTESGTNTKVRADIIRTFGKNANSYIDKFHNDENGSTKTERSGLEKLANLNKKASIGFNVRVLVQQPTSIARAYMFLSPKDIPASIKGAALIKEMRETCPIAYWKSLGFRDIGTGSTMKDVLINNESLYSKLEMGGYGLVDDFTWGLIYGAVKNETKRLNPDLKVGSKEFNDKVRDRFDYIVDRTQVVDSVFHRTQSMRSDNYLTKTTTMFMSESLKTYNLYRTEMKDAVKEKRKFKTAARATAVYTVSNFLLALMQAFPDAWREDDEKELYDKNGNPIGYWSRYWENVWENFGNNMNPLNSFPIIKDVWSMVQGFQGERVEYSRINDLIISAKNLGNNKMSLPAKLTSLTTSAAAVFGISAGNLKRDVFGLAETVFRANGDEYNDYLIDKFKYNVNNSSNKNRFMKHYERAISNGHPEDAAIILEDYLSENYNGKFDNKHTKTVVKEVSKLYGKTKEDQSKLIFGVPEQKFSFDGEDVKISDKDYPEYVEKTYNTLFDLAYEMINDERYKDLPIEEKVRNFGELEQFAEQSQRPEYVKGYELDGGWKNDLYNGKINYMDNAMERYADRIFEDKKDEYKEKFVVNEKDYSEAEFSTVESVINDWSGYLASKDLGREIDPSEDRYLIVYDEKLSDDMSIEEYAGVRAYAKKTAALYDLNDDNPNEGTEDLTSEELENYLDSTDYSWEVKGALFMSIGNSNWYNKYTGLKNNGEPYKGKGGNKSGSSNGRTSRTTTRSTGSRTTTSTRTNSKTTTRATRTTTIRSNR